MSDILIWYVKHRPDLICERLYQAGRRLQSDWEIAFSGKTNSNFNISKLVKKSSISQTIDVANFKAEYFSKISNALHFVGSPDLDQILIDIICHGLSMKDFEQKNNWRFGVGGYILRIALSKLNQYYEKIDELSQN